MHLRMFNIFRSYKGLSRNIYILFIARIINGIGNFVYPFLTLFLTEKLGFGAAEAGKFIFIAAIMAGAGALAGGKLCDICSRKKVAIISQGIMALLYLPCAFLGKSILVPCFLVLLGFFAGASLTVNNAMATDVSNKHNRKVVFSLLYLGNNIGFAIGPTVAGILYHKYLSWLFLGNTVLILISITLIYVFIEDSILVKHKEEEVDELNYDREKAEEGSMIEVLLKRPALVFFSFIAIIYSFVYAQHPFMIPIQVGIVFGDNGPAIFGTLMSINGLVVVATTTIVTHFTKKYRTVTNMVLAGLFYAVGFGMLIFVKSYVLFVLSTMIWTIGEILSATNLSVYVVNNTPISHRGRFNSLTLIINGVGFAIGPAIMGRFIEIYNINCAWVFVFILALSGAVMMGILALIEKKRENSLVEKLRLSKAAKNFQNKEIAIYKED